MILMSYDIMWYDIIWYNMIWHGIILYITYCIIKCDKIRYNSICYHIIMNVYQHSTNAFINLIVNEYDLACFVFWAFLFFLLSASMIDLTYLILSLGKAVQKRFRDFSDDQFSKVFFIIIIIIIINLFTVSRKDA